MSLVIKMIDYLAFSTDFLIAVRGIVCLVLATMLWLISRESDKHSHLQVLPSALFFAAGCSFVRLVDFSLGRVDALIFFRQLFFLSAWFLLWKFILANFFPTMQKTVAGLVFVGVCFSGIFTGSRNIADPMSVWALLMGVPAVLLLAAKSFGRRRYVAFTGFTLLAAFFSWISSERGFIPFSLMSGRPFYPAPEWLSSILFILGSVLLVIELEKMWRELYGQSEQFKKTRRSYSGVLFTSMLIIVFSGALITAFVDRETWKGNVEILKNWAVIAAGSLDREMLKTMAGDCANQEMPEYVYFRGHFLAMNHATSSIRWFYLMFMQNEKIIFGVDSIPKISPSYSPPGDEYQDAPAGLLPVFKGNGPTVLGPYKDQWGEFFSGFAPVNDNAGNVLGVLGIDIEAEQIIREIYQHRLAPVMGTVLLCGMVLLFFVILRSQQIAAVRILDSEVRYRQMFEENSAPMLLIEPTSGAVSDANPSASEFYAYPRTELCRKNIVDLSADPADEVLAKIDSINRNQRGNFVASHYLSSGERRFVEVFAVALVIQGVRQLFLIIHDITARKLAENHLQQLEVAVEQSPAAIVITNLSGVIQYVNPVFTRMTGYSKDEATGKNPKILKSGKMSAEEYNNLWQTISGGKTWRGRFYNRRKDGSFFWEEASISPIKNEAGAITSYIAVKEDVTERIESERLLQEVQEDLAIRLQEIGETIVSIHKTFLLGSFPPIVEGVDAFAAIEPVMEVGGDFVDFFAHSESEFDVIAGDVMGKGMGPALLGVSIVYSYSRSLQELNAISQAKVPDFTEAVSAMLERVNRHFAEFSSFSTVFLARFDLKAAKLKFLNFGHPEILHYMAASGVVETLDATNRPVGIESGPLLPEERLFASNDLFIILSDGILDAQNASGERFGSDRVVKLLKLHRKEAPATIGKCLLTEVRRFSGSQGLKDDATCIILKV